MAFDVKNFGIVANIPSFTVFFFATGGLTPDIYGAQWLNSIIR